MIVVATGTFDLLHPGHLYYLQESRALGDELHVIVARDKNVLHKPAPIVPEMQRLVMVSALSLVTSARLGDPMDMMRPIEEIQPDIITLGCDQHFSEQDLEQRLKARGISARVVRIGKYAEYTYCSSREIVHSILERRW
ncbi:MAG: FAD synthase [Methanomicrobiales archaeon]|jgi:FAD synthetase|nr:FAD synthase [Methanomicrobiales archaeon]